MKKLEIAEMEMLTGGNKALSVLCGAGIALSLFTGGIGALILGPATAGVCYASTQN